MYTKEDREIISKIGRYHYKKMKEKGMTFEEYQLNKELSKKLKKQIQHEKEKIRFKTIRFIERYCNIKRKCQICGEKAEIHHPNYKDWLKVNFLCKTHHTALHNFELIPPQIIDLEKISNRKIKYCPK